MATTKPAVKHAGLCGAQVTCTRVDGQYVWTCERGHHLSDPRELTPRGAVFTPIRKPPIRWERVQI